MYRQNQTPKLAKEVGEKCNVNYHRIVVKVGTTLLTHGSEKLNLEVIGSLVKQIAKLTSAGTEVILVSSGAVAAGRQVLGVSREEKDVPFKQVLAATGQGRLMQIYEQLFEPHGIPVAQALLSRKDLNDRLGYLNVRNTLMSLLELKVVPIINENDVVAVDELSGDHFGDNDTLSAMVSNLVDADLLMLLGDVDGLYTSDPHLDPNAELVSIVKCLDGEIESMGGGSWDNSGQGGMVTKLGSAKMATSTGVNVVIANGLVPHIVSLLASGERIGTYLPATSTKMESRKRWMLSGGPAVGKLTIDSGAEAALANNNRSLLPAGVTKVCGTFNRGQVVAIFGPMGRQIAVGIANYSSEDLNIVKGEQSHHIDALIPRNFGATVVHRSNMVIL